MRAAPPDHRLLLGPAAARAWDRRRAALPEPSAGTVVSVASLCAAPDLDAALARLREQLGPGGHLAFLEHVGRAGRLGRVERRWGEAVAKLPWACHLGRDVPAALRRAGFFVTDLERFTMPTPVPLLRSWVSGNAVVPA